MRLLLDECVPRRLTRELAGHQAKTVQDLGWAGIKNGALLQLANGRFDALLTVDQGIEYQQNLSASALSSWWRLATISKTCARWWQASNERFQDCGRGRLSG